MKVILLLLGYDLLISRNGQQVVSNPYSVGDTKKARTVPLKVQLLSGRCLRGQAEGMAWRISPDKGEGLA